MALACVACVLVYGVRVVPKAPLMKSLSARYALVGLVTGILLGVWSSGLPDWAGSGDLIARHFGELTGDGLLGGTLGWGLGALKARQLRRGTTLNDRPRPSRRRNGYGQ